MAVGRDKIGLTLWYSHLVPALIRLMDDETLPRSFGTEDDAQMCINDCLNDYVALSRYKWPDFLGHGYTYCQSISLRRALVQEIFKHMKDAGSIRVEVREDIVQSSGANKGHRDPIDGVDGGSEPPREANSQSSNQSLESSYLPDSPDDNTCRSERLTPDPDSTEDLASITRQLMECTNLQREELRDMIHDEHFEDIMAFQIRSKLAGRNREISVEL
ncbi:unnamed protein product [Periconia digitata]|uniref:Uncharacterized protein n=1 Tax=Periconia digitata TaxID=1303443 RepID=A0A9W4UX92_9PLEO|nr:unnamed protein product [Periconia digitata]